MSLELQAYVRCDAGLCDEDCTVPVRIGIGSHGRWDIDPVKLPKGWRLVYRSEYDYAAARVACPKHRRLKWDALEKHKARGDAR